MSSGPFAGQTVVVTGGGYGLGLSIVAHFARAGAHVILADVEDDSHHLNVRKLNEAGGAVSFLPVDLNEREAILDLVDDVIAIRGGVDVWVNYDGAGLHSAAETLEHDRWAMYLNAKLSGTWYAAQAVGKHMLARGRGVIVNVVSAAAIMPIEGHAARSIAEAGVLMLTQALGIEWAKRGVRVVGVLSGPLDTGQAGEVRATFERRSPMHRLGAADEVAEAVLYVASEQASYIVGETLRVDGGWTAYQLF